MSWGGDIFRSRRVLVTGHTGFKGAWLCEWLVRLGAKVTGVALEPPTQPALFEQLGLSQRIEDVRVDIRDAGLVARTVSRIQPEFVFHLAAQSLVRAGYREPVETFHTNTLGTVHMLEAVRTVGAPCAVVVATTDKCYLNSGGSNDVFDEESRLGGHDPYSASKAAAELAVSAYREAYFAGNSRIAVGTARAGNVIGGGDWAEDRIVPDCVRAAAAGRALQIRNPQATRPWQHVVEPLAGYLRLAAALADPQHSQRARTAFNFGPPEEDVHTVRELVDAFRELWPCGVHETSVVGDEPKEAHHLTLDASRAGRLLGWQPQWSFAETVRRTVKWYRDTQSGEIGADAAVLRDIAAYEEQTTWSR